jgi:excinuclease ABC subunit C
MSVLEEKLKSIPEKPGVYLMKDEKGKIIYVGKAKSLKSRVSSYFRNNKHDSAKTRILVKKIQDLEYILTDTEAEALILENNLIKKHKPRYNIDLKDDKTYPFIKVTREEFPRVMVTRNIVKDGSQYYGPYTSVGALKETMELLKRLFPFRSCNNTMFRNHKPCLNYHIKKCYAPCAGKISKEDYREIISNIESFLKGQKNEIEKNLVKKWKGRQRSWSLKKLPAFVIK